MTYATSRQAAAKWQLVSGVELFELYQSGESLTTLLPTVSAVYMWKLRLADDHLVSHDPDLTLRHLIRLTRTPQGRTLPIAASHGLTSLGIEVCGPGLPSFKQKTLAKFLTKPKNNRWMISYLRNLEQHLPALYVGETGNLPKRAKEHLAGLTDFGQTIGQERQLDWADLNFYYTSLGSATEVESAPRRAIEYITAVLTISAFTRRPG
jgi:hypothetical protein